MKSSDSLSKLAPALAKAQAEFKGVGKSGFNKFDSYKYANLEDYITTVREVLALHGLSVLSSSEEIVPLEDRTTKNGGKEHAVRVRLTTRIVHESGEWIETCSCGEGQDRADKSVYKAITGARKYALASALNLATTDDPEQDDDHEPPPTKQQRRERIPDGPEPQARREPLPVAGRAPSPGAETVKQLASETPGLKTADKIVPPEWQAKLADAQQQVAQAQTPEALEELIDGWKALEFPEPVKAALRPLYSARKALLLGSTAQSA